MRKLISNLSASSIRGVLAFTVILYSFSILIILLFHPIPPENKDTIQVMAGLVIGASVGAIMGYYYGSSKDKTDGDKVDKIQVTGAISATAKGPE